MGDARSLAPGAPSARAGTVRVPRAYADQSIRAQIIIPFVFHEHPLTRASMPKS